MPRTHQLPLSLKHFDPVKQPPPYVNTPRSLEACRIHGIQPVELLHKPLLSFRESPDEADEIVWYRYMRHEESRKRLLQRAARTREELVQSGWASSDGEGTPTLVAQQAKHAAWAEQRELFELQKMIMHELQQAYQLQALKENLEKQETAFDKIDEQKRALQKKLDEHRKQLVEEAAENEREAERRLAMAKNLERKKAIEEQRKQQADELNAKREAEQKEAVRVRGAQEAKQARERINNMQEMVHQEKIKRLVERNSLRQHKSRTQKQARDALQEAKFREAARKRENAAETMRSREDAKLRATTDHVDEYEHRARVRQMQLDGLREQMRQHAERVAEAHRKRKEQLDERMERQKAALLAKLDKKQQDSEAARAKTQAQREQQAAMRKIRHEEWLQSQERKRRAQSYWMEQVSHSVESKEWKQRAIQHTKRELVHVTGNIKQAIRKTRAELREEFQQLHKMDSYTPEAILEVVDRLADELLIPQIQSTWKDADRPRGSRNGALFELRNGAFSRPAEHADDDEGSLSEGQETSVQQPADTQLNLSGHGGMTRPTTAPEAATRSRVELSKHYPNTARGLAGASASPPRSPLREFAPPIDKAHIMRTLLIENERLKHQHQQQRQLSSRRGGTEARWSHTPARSLPPFQLKPPSRLETCLGDKPMSAKPKARKRRRSKFNASLSDYQWNTTAPASLEGSQRSSFGIAATPTARGGEQVETTGQGNPQSSTQSSAPAVLIEHARDSSLSARPSEGASTDLSPPNKLQELSSSFSTLAHVRKSQSQLLMTILSQEQHAEMERQEALAKCANTEERHALELAFAEERTRASQRILQLTQEHETELKRLSQELQADAESTEQ